MLNLVTQQAGQWLNLTTAGIVLTTSFQGGAAFGLQGCTAIDVPIFAGFDAATDKTTIDFQLQVSDDNATWFPIESVDVTLTTATAAAVTHSLAASAGNTVLGRLQLPANQSIQAKYVRIAAKYTGGTAPKANDSAKSNLNYDAN